MIGEFYIQKQGQLINITNNINEYDWIYTNKNYVCGTYKFALDKIPVCKLCGSPLKFILKCGRKLKSKKNYFLIIDGCTNKNCKTQNLSKNNRICQNAFLPESIIEQEHNKRSEHSKLSIENICNLHNCSEQEALDYIQKQKRIRINNGKSNKGANRKEQYIKKYGEEYGLLKMYNDNPLHVDHWINKGLSESEAINKIKTIQLNNSKKVKKHPKISKDYYKRLYDLSDESVNILIKEKSQWCKEYWIKRGYSEDNAKNIISNLQQNNSNKRTCYITTKNVEYWINKGFSLEEAKNIISESQKTFSKDICINKYGYDEGIKIFTKRQNKWQYTLHNSNNMCNGYSNISQELFNILSQLYEDDTSVYYATKNKEYSIYYENKRYIYDFVDIKSKKIIEFNGDLFHANPKYFTKYDNPNPLNKTKTAEQIWQHDDIKRQICELHGFKILYVWESEYKNDKENIINNCKKFLFNET